MDKINKEPVDKDLYSEKSLSLLNIRDLRDLGRKFGVPSPTTLKKQEIVDYILKIVYGEIAVPERNVCGRPSVREFDMDKYVNKIKKNTVLTDQLLKYKLEDNFDFVPSKLASSNSKVEEEENIEQRVFVKENGKYYLRTRSFVESDDDIEITKSIVEKYKLENLDVIELVLGEDFFKIISVNGIKIVDKFKEISVQTLNLKGGSKEVFYLRTKEEIEKDINSLKKSAESQNIKFLLFSSNKNFKSKVGFVTFDESDTYSSIYKSAMKFVQMCEQAMFNSEDVLVVVDEAKSVLKAIDSFEKDVSERIKKHLNSTIDRLLKTGNVLIFYRVREDITY